jgi:hypothetical protein
MFRQLGLCSSAALVRNRDLIKSRGIRLMRPFLGDELLTAAETMVALEGR